uniref:Uncharacterized protein TCIL3000_11_9600 n=1 Tax=Trypanosoma congolense (strain IL3000) TaxID=1068625 RepID=G0V1H2_TRYCI|nr:unnamed protein product [Trypanosoma congolense IL3000]
MDVYRQASEIVRIVREGTGTAKALCLRKEMQKKRQTYAVVCETLRHYELLQDVLEQAEFFQYYPRANRDYAICMAYDAVLGKGVNTNRDTTAQAIQRSLPYLREAYQRVVKHHIIPSRAGEFSMDEMDGTHPECTGGAKGGYERGAGKIPRYARVNTLKIDVDSLVERLRRSSEKREREEPVPAFDTEPPRHHHVCHRVAAQGLPQFTLDPIVPSLLVFPPGTDLHAHPAVRSGQLVLQDRASCLPVCVLLDAVEVCVPFHSRRGVDGCSNSNATTSGAPPALEYIVDACAAPGNKTTQLAALGAPHVKIMAIERDEERAKLLQRRVQTLGAADYVNVVNMDFLKMSREDREATEGILLDPSCSASGVVTRVDVSLTKKQRLTAADAHATDDLEAARGTADAGADKDAVGAISVELQGANFASNTERVMGLARLQRKLLAHSLLSFDNCRTVVYSTCSVHEAENEDVVRQVLEDSRVQERGWVLSNIMPTTWETRGRRRSDDTFPLEYTVRCDPTLDATNGFFVARLDRVVTKQQEPSGKEKVSKKPQHA